MNRYWTAVPIVVMAGVPVWTMPGVPVAAIEGIAVLFCGLGVFSRTLAPVTAGGVLALIGYAAAVWSKGGGTDAIGATVFGLALLFLLDFSEFARRLQGVAVSAAAMRGQIRFWLGRAALAAAAVVPLVLGAVVLAPLVPGESRAIIAGIGALAAFAGAVCAGVIRRER